MTTHNPRNRLVALVGRPNVGKSSIFNRIIKERKSLVHDEPGVTRDRIFGRAVHNFRPFFVCDTGGFEPTSKDNIKTQLVHQAEIAIEEAELVVLVVDLKYGLQPDDVSIARRLQKAKKQFIVVANKADQPHKDDITYEFQKLGVSDILPISAEHNRGFDVFLDEVFKTIYPDTPDADATDQKFKDTSIKLAILGRPNVGKSTILNRILGEDRSLVDDRPGTTRDAVDAKVRYFGRDLTLIDTAGIRRKSRMTDMLEKFSAFRSLMVLEDADVAILVISAKDGITEGDVRVVGHAFELRKPILVVVNKWDTVENKTSKTIDEFLKNLRIELSYVSYAPIITTSALENLRVNKILEYCVNLYDESIVRHTTSKVNECLKHVLTKHTPPLLKNRSKRIKFFYATQVGVLPPRFVIFCSYPNELHFSYKRFVENSFREYFEYKNVPISIVFRERARSDHKDS